MNIELKEVLMSFGTKELECFTEATRTCTDEQKTAVAKRIRDEKLPEGWHFTESQIKKFVAEESEQVNWYPGVKINNGTGDNGGTMQEATTKVEEYKERQFNTYRASGMSIEEASAMSGFKTAKQ